ncbi:uncharacterized protein ASPGLDRAFT_678569 [Aspergillus glaucus CBS 516.65]|uniref:Uncharacterized protein n=1 Tax=Aspergillus glaucus CBS 516.65 TaxID=1160497 RepID=A0A1L9VWC2_ASPGL|nr:hypothetical protein ASPGLDRAFT_678569 [Aspergillus glaucus CBS 516.65]OJJ88204.1 hypothetical protein ASPGLDRAFT_678569 [Aspergillus glaucus CBS 516.65]
MVAGLDYIVPKAPLLSTAFPIAHQLAGVHAPIHVDEGLIYHGGAYCIGPHQAAQGRKYPLALRDEVEFTAQNFRYQVHEKALVPETGLVPD